MITLLVILLFVATVVAGLVAFTARTARKIEAAFPPRGQFREIDGQRIHYIDEGNGPVIVMIHGLGGNMGNFTYALVDRLANDFRVIAVDRPGAGYSTRPKNASAAIGAQAATIAKFIEALKLDKPLLVGHSLGGAISLAIALNHPDCAGGLALIAPLTHEVGKAPKAFRALAISSPLMRTIVGWTLATPLSILNRDKVLPMVFGPEKVPVDFGARGGGFLGLRPKSFYATSTDFVAAPDDVPGLVRRYSSLAIPFGMLFARGDRVLDYREQGEAMKAACPALDLVLMEGGHMLPLTSPEPCVELIQRIASRRVT
jgi:pimeloyl-ACP methyl ester carboxylesterase